MNIVWAVIIVLHITFVLVLSNPIEEETESTYKLCLKYETDGDEYAGSDDNHMVSVYYNASGRWTGYVETGYVEFPLDEPKQMGTHGSECTIISGNQIQLDSFKVTSVSIKAVDGTNGWAIKRLLVQEYPESDKYQAWGLGTSMSFWVDGNSDCGSPCCSDKKLCSLQKADEKVCYCQHKDKGSPNNGIMCGYNCNDASFTRNGYCQTGEVCSEVGKDDSKKNRVSVDEKGSLCTKAEKVCYCEYKDKGSPKNGIMCGYNGGTFTRNGYCQTQEVCSGVGKTDSESKRVEFNQKRTLCTKVQRVCYCEHHNGGTPKNGIMCGYNGGTFNRDGYCSTHEKCTGVTQGNNEDSRVPDHQKGDLCT